MANQRRRGLGRIRGRRGLRTLMVVGALFATAELVGVASAFGNAANPNPDTTGTYVVNGDNTVTATLSGTWSWPNQSCEGRYGEGWAVDWWGISSSKRPANPFSLTNATEVTGPGVTTTGTISPFGAIQIKGTGPGPGGGTYFHVAQYYAGEDVNSTSTCTDSGSGPNVSSSGSWTATATYPSKADIPPQVCVNIYDEHGTEGSPSKSANDFSPLDGDNSIQTNKFDPTSGAGYCVSLVPAPRFRSERSAVWASR